MTTATQTNLAKFRQVYADAVKPDLVNSDVRETLRKTRLLYWHGPRVSLAEAASLYSEIDGYNDFSHDAIARLAAEFPDAGIEATVARESSPVIYLHVPADCITAAAWIEVNLSPSEVDFVTKFSCLQEGETELDGEALRVWWD